MKLYELTLNNVFYVDQQRKDIYLVHIRYPQYFTLKQPTLPCVKAKIDIKDRVERPEVRFHEGKFTRFNVTYHFPNTGLSKPDYKVNLLFYSEFIKITRTISSMYIKICWNSCQMISLKVSWSRWMNLKKTSIMMVISGNIYRQHYKQ